MLGLLNTYKFIEGFNEQYFITNKGNIYSYKSHKWRKMNSSNITNKYKNIKLSKNNKVYTYMIHRLVAKYFCKNFTSQCVVDHIDANIHNNHYLNLQCITQQRNILKSYVDSGVNEVRNYKTYILFSPEHKPLALLKGKVKSLRMCIRDLRLPIKFTMLSKHYRYKGYYLKTISKEEYKRIKTVTTIPIWE